MRGTRKTPVTVEPSRWVFGPEVPVEACRDRLQPGPLYDPADRRLSGGRLLDCEVLP